MTTQQGNPRSATVRVHFTAADGTLWRIIDATWSNGAHHPRPIGDPTATDRIFVRVGAKRVYRFSERESRVLEVQAIERQFQASEPGATLRSSLDA